MTLTLTRRARSEHRDLLDDRTALRAALDSLEANVFVADRRLQLVYLNRRAAATVAGLDRAFVASLGTPSADSRVVRLIVELGRTLDLVTVAEGVETEAQRAELAALGCDAVQGFLFARPVPADGIDDLLARPEAWARAGAERA